MGPISFFRHCKWFTRIVAQLVTALMIYWPVTLHADAFLDAASTGTASGITMQDVYVNSMPTFDGTETFTFSSGETIGTYDLFPDAAGASTAVYSNTYGNDTDAVVLGITTQNNLLTEESNTGTAYRLLLKDAQEPQGELVGDTMFLQIENSLTNADVITEFSGCTEDDTWTATDTVYHVPDYQICREVTDNKSSCEITHLYEGAMEQLSGAQQYAFCGSGCVDLYLGKAGDNNLQGGACTHFTFDQTIRIKDPSLVLSATLEHVQYDDYSRIQINGTTIWSGSGGYDPSWTSCERSKSLSSTPMTDLTTLFQTAGDIHFRQQVGVGDGGEAYARIRVLFDPTRLLSVDEWNPPECMFNVTNNQDCAQTITCNSLPPGTSGWTPSNPVCAVVNGSYICSGDFTDPPPGLNPFCTNATVDTQCLALEGPGACYTDMNGDLQCPDTTGLYTDDEGASTCADLEADPACSFIEQACTDGAFMDGKCRMWSKTYDCGFDTNITDYSKTTSLSCGASIRCLGDECTENRETQSTSFNDVYAALQMAQQANWDADCEGMDPSACQIFEGTREVCREGVFGLVDCCEGGGGTSWIQYLELIKEAKDAELIGDFTSLAMDNSETLSTIVGELDSGWQALKEPVANTWGDVVEAWDATYEATTKTFTNAVDSLTGTTTEVATNVATATPTETVGFMDSISSSITAFEQQAFEYAYNFLDGFGAADTFISFDGVTYELQGWLGTLGTIYTYYQIFMLIVNILYSCKQSEMELNAKRATKSCHYVGSWCSSDSLFGCFETSQAYCCFNSPLSRIIAEQIRLQGIGSWGTPENTNCEGIAMADMELVDWEAVDLSEWIGMLDVAGMLPDPTSITIESLTGDGSFIDYQDAGRDNIAERTTDRMTGPEYDQVIDYSTKGAELQVPDVLVPDIP